MANKQTAKLYKATENGEGLAQAGMEAGMQAENQARRQAERLQEAQNRLINIYSTFMTHWLQRRQIAAQATLELAQRAVEANGQPGRLPELYSEWMNGSMERIAADIRECQECGGEIVAAMQDSLPLGGDFRPGAMSERVRD